LGAEQLPRPNGQTEETTLVIKNARILLQELAKNREKRKEVAAMQSPFY